ALATPEARHLSILGSGAVALAHLHYVKDLRPWQSIRLYSPTLASKPAEELAQLQALDPRLQLVPELEAAVDDADVIMLCTSSAGPAIDPRTLHKPALITSISTNAPRAHDVPPAALPELQVYCDYRRTTPGPAGEMLIAGEHHGWDS
ncbi:ornithine cyclodeaminase family protein, partial [Pseudomonas sp. MWU12-2534b]